MADWVVRASLKLDWSLSVEHFGNFNVDKLAWNGSMCLLFCIAIIMFSTCVLGAGLEGKKGR